MADTEKRRFGHLLNSNSYLFTINEAARILRIGRAALLTLIEEGHLPFIVHQNRQFVMHSDLLSYCNKRAFIYRKNKLTEKQ